ncbi:hypothetical protein ACQPYK_49815 (plasmid) [Streptosporangium sp. CA-135522]|uniref:hypothetical protein n=1 Tax=Streptosporangium sp. CA-135522 TaxID=3240072 RepID=UPI003D8F8F48
MSSLANPSDLTLEALVDAAAADVFPTSEQWGWAEDEIQQAMKRHPWAADTIWHSFALLRATQPLMRYERPYRAHCRELLDRVAASLDTRPGTAAEMCCVASAISKITPMNSSGFGTYMRALTQAFPDLVADLDVTSDRLSHHEALNGERIDDLEGQLRRRLTVDDRTLGTIACQGRHHGESVLCRYATSVSTFPSLVTALPSAEDAIALPPAPACVPPSADPLPTPSWSSPLGASPATEG